MLRLLILLCNDDSARYVRDPHRAVRGIDGLSARTRGAIHIDPQILLIDIDIDVFRLGKNRNGGRGGMNASLRLGVGHPLHPVHARFELKPRIDAVA